MIDLTLLQYVAYFVFLLSLVAYAALDGFDLGVGCLHFFAKGDRERRLMINSIGPVWDGNTTWIVIGSGVLFAGFPKVFAILMSNLYTPVMGLIFAFMLRGVAVEFRSKNEKKWWRNSWDGIFFLASLVLATDVGLLLGNMIQGFPIDHKGVLRGGFLGLLNPYAILISTFGLCTFIMHGSIYLLMKTEGELHHRLRRWCKRSVVIFLILWVMASLITFIHAPHMIRPFVKSPALLIFAFLSFLSILIIPRALKRKQDGWAFIASCSSIVFLFLLFLIGTFPYIVYSTIEPAKNSMTLYDSSSSYTTLGVIALIALLGIPLSFFYFSYLYRTFKGKIKIDSHSY